MSTPRRTVQEIAADFAMGFYIGFGIGIVLFSAILVVTK